MPAAPQVDSVNASLNRSGGELYAALGDGDDKLYILNTRHVESACC
jgi:hypothetical protein